MTITSNSILKLLSDLSITSDKIIEEDSHTERETGQVLKWFEMIKTHALAVANYKPTSSTVEEECSIPFSGKEVPSLDSFLKGPSERGRRLLSDVSQMAKDNLHKGKQSHLQKKNKSQLNVSSRDLSDKKVNERETIVHSEVNKSTAQKETPLGKKDNQLKELKKRKSSSELSTESSKRLCTTNKIEANGFSRKSPRIIKLAKLAELKKASSSVSSNINTSILKENTIMRSKEAKVNENLKATREKEKAARKLKIDENKRKRDEKVEQTNQQKLQLEQEKIKKLRSRNCANSSKNEAKTNLENKRLNGRENEVKNTILANKNNSIKKLQTSLVVKKVVDLKNQEKKEKGLGRTPPSCLKKNEIASTQKALQTGSTKNEKNAMNGTFLVKEESSTEVEKKEEKCPKLFKEANSEVTKNNELNSEKIVKKVEPHIEKSQSDKSKKLTSSYNTPAQKKNESYVITPVRSSFVSYDISEIKSESEEEEDENQKPIPSWATGIHLRNALLQQHHHPLNTDELFGNYFPPLDLNLMMGIKKKLYKRTSSAIWNSSFT